MLTPAFSRQRISGTGGDCLLLQRDSSSDEMPEILHNFAGKVQCIYIDPPFMSGSKYSRKRPVGEKGWKTGEPAINLESYQDNFSEQDYYIFLKKIVQNAYVLLNNTGVMYLHLDWHGDYIGRIVLNQVFGASNFVDEIIWAYSTGGRSRRYFSHKHDTILMAKKGSHFPFDITKIPLESSNSGRQRNHMRTEIDEFGNAWHTIKSGGKIYRYDAFAPEYPTDVWSDISHLQQRDPERTGFLTQKPSKLLERLLFPVLSEGDIFADLTCGSGTSLAAAEKIGCRIIGVDSSSGALAVTEHRIASPNLSYLVGSVESSLPLSQPATLDITLQDNRLLLHSFNDGSNSFDGLDGIESYHIGSFDGDIVSSHFSCKRTRKCPQLITSPEITADDNCIDIISPTGQRFVFQFR